MDAVCRVVHCVVMRVKGATDRPLLSVVDDDESVRESLPDLLEELGFTARAPAQARGKQRYKPRRQQIYNQTYY